MKWCTYRDWKWLLLVAVFSLSDLFAAQAYTPSKYVQRIHALPHLSFELGRRSNKFEADEEYFMSLLPFPIILSCILLVLLLIYLGTLFSRYCCQCAKCGLEFDKDNPERILQRRWKLHVAFFVVCLLTVAAVLTVFIGNAKITHGVKRGINSIQWLKGVVNSFIDKGYRLRNQGDVIDDALKEVKGQCSYANEYVRPYLDDYESAVEEYIESIEDIPSQLTDVQALVKKNGIDRKDKYLFQAFTYTTFLVAMFMIGLILSSGILLRLSIAISMALMLGVSILCSVILIVLMFLADICMDPDRTLLSYLTPPASYTVEYYIQCVGEDPLEDYMELADLKNNDMWEEVIELLENNKYCPNNEILEALLDTFQLILDVIENVYEQLNCIPVRAEYRNIVHDGVCSDVFEGMYNIWLSLSIAMLFMFILMIITSIIYELYHHRIREFLHDLKQEGIEIEMARAARPSLPKLHFENNDTEAIYSGAMQPYYKKRSSMTAEELYEYDRHVQCQAALKDITPESLLNQRYDIMKRCAMERIKSEITEGAYRDVPPLYGGKSFRASSIVLGTEDDPPPYSSRGWSDNCVTAEAIGDSPPDYSPRGWKDDRLPSHSGLISSDAPPEYSPRGWVDDRIIDTSDTSVENALFDTPTSATTTIHSGDLETEERL